VLNVTVNSRYYLESLLICIETSLFNEMFWACVYKKIKKDVLNVTVNSRYYLESLLTCIEISLFNEMFWACVYKKEQERLR
jgi:hypothetical protein